MELGVLIGNCLIQAGFIFYPSTDKSIHHKNSYLINDGAQQANMLLRIGGKDHGRCCWSAHCANAAIKFGNLLYKSSFLPKLDQTHQIDSPK
jgi:hypothetical protein